MSQEFTDLRFVDFLKKFACPPLKTGKSETEEKNELLGVTDTDVL
jgi:hypothetical protein